MMQRRFDLVCVSSLIFLGFFFLSSCHFRVQDPGDPRFIVAEGDGVQVTQGELQEALQVFLNEEETARQYGPSKFHFLQTLLVDQILSDKLILSQPATLSLPPQDQVEKDLFTQVVSRSPTEKDFTAKLKRMGLTEEKLKSNIHKTLLVQQALQAEAYHQVNPTEQEVEAFYLQHRDRFTIPNKIRASRILLMVDDTMSATVKASKKKTINEARNRILAGEDFAQVAGQVSEDRYSAPQGGDIGYFERGENEDQFDEVAFQTEPGKISPVFLTPLGYQFLKVTDTMSGGKMDVASARRMIADYLKKQKMKEQEEAYRQKLIRQAHVIYHFIRSTDPEPASSDSPRPVLPVPPHP